METYGCDDPLNATSSRILNATHVGLTVDTLWYYLVKNFDNRQVLDFAYWYEHYRSINRDGRALTFNVIYRGVSVSLKPT